MLDRIYFRMIVKAIDTGDFSELKPYLSDGFYQDFWEYYDRTNKKPDKLEIRKLLIKWLWPTLMKSKISKFEERLQKGEKLQKYRISHPLVSINFVVEAESSEDAEEEFKETIICCVWPDVPDSFWEINPTVELIG